MHQQDNPKIVNSVDYDQNTSQEQSDDLSPAV